VATLRALAAELGLKTSVEFHVDVSYEDVVRHLRGAVAGLHAMLDEHFGICVVEYQAAGAVAIAHDSAGPKMDIVVPSAPREDAVGFLATTETEFADAIVEVMTMRADAREAIAARARARSSKFSEAAFASGLRDAFVPLVYLTRRDDEMEASRRGGRRRRRRGSLKRRLRTRGDRRTTTTRGAATRRRGSRRGRRARKRML
jgi:glycosyltransferase involved in cell wall biosynthesis